MFNQGNFSGEPKTIWLTESGVPDRRMRVLEDFSFSDPTEKVWPAPAGYDGLNGASIPRALWSLVGSPYTGDYRRAAIVHDYACDVGINRKDADRMFYHACRAGGCGVVQATLLYIGVRIGAWLGSLGSLHALNESVPFGPRISRTKAEIDLEAFYQQVAHEVLFVGEVDDPLKLEPLVDGSIHKVAALGTFQWVANHR